MKVLQLIVVLFMSLDAVSQNKGELEVGYFSDVMRLRATSKLSLNNFLLNKEDHVFVNWKWTDYLGNTYFIKLPMDEGLVLRQFEVGTEKPYKDVFFRGGFRRITYLFDDLKSRERIDSHVPEGFYRKSQPYETEPEDVFILALSGGIHHQRFFRWVELHVGFDAYFGRQKRYIFGDVFKTSASNKVIACYYQYDPSFVVSPQADLAIFFRPLKSVSIGYRFRGRVDFIREHASASYSSWTAANSIVTSSNYWVANPVAQNQLSIKVRFNYVPFRRPLPETSPPPGTSAARR